MSGNSKLDSSQAVALFGIMVATVISAQHMFSKIPAFNDSANPPAVLAVIAGVIISLLVYLPVKVLYGGGNSNLSNSQLMSISALVGLVSANFMTFGVQSGMPNIRSMALMVFVFYYQLDQHVF